MTISLVKILYRARFGLQAMAAGCVGALALAGGLVFEAHVTEPRALVAQALSTGHHVIEAPGRVLIGDKSLVLPGILDAGSSLLTFDKATFGALYAGDSSVAGLHYDLRVSDPLLSVAFKRPIAQWTRGDGLALVAADGSLFDRLPPLPDLDRLVELRGATRPRHVPALVSALEEAGLAVEDLRHAEWIADRRFSLVLRSGATILMPGDPADFPSALSRALRLLDGESASARPIAVDARLEDRLFVGIANGN